ncbi:MAG: C45 family peptidase [Phycisphaerales bacterium]
MFSYNPLRTLASLKKVDDFPLYRMEYKGAYLFGSLLDKGIDRPVFRRLYRAVSPGACTSFVASGGGGKVVFGRNFDWSHKASLLLYTDPPGGYASVSMVDLYYLGLDGMAEIPWTKRLTLLAAPHAAIDGMNECGVAIAQNAVPRRQTPKDPNKPTVLNSQIVRLVLDRARDVNEAIALIRRYNVDFAGTCVHFHVADASGESAVVEYGDRGIVVVRGKSSRVSTNFLLSEANEPDCWRYRRVSGQIDDASTNGSFVGVMSLLESVSLPNTVWSAVYNLSTGEVRLVMGKDYDRVHQFRLDMRTPKRRP